MQLGFIDQEIVMVLEELGSQPEAQMHNKIIRLALDLSAGAEVETYDSASLGSDTQTAIDQAHRMLYES